MLDIKRQSTEERRSVFLKGEGKGGGGVQETKKSKKLAIFVSVVFVIMLAVAGSVAYYYYNQYKEAMKNPVAENKDEAQSITDTIGKFMELPEGEEPTMATVTDVGKINDQPFFAKAKNGDKVLIYSKSEKAILYRPATGKIIEVSTVSGTGNEDVPVSADESTMQNSEEILPVDGGIGSDTSPVASQTDAGYRQ